MIELKSPSEVDAMAVAGAFVAQAIDAVITAADVGVDLRDLELIVRGMIADRGAESCYWDYSPDFGRGPFRNTVCLSVNDAVLHGLPHAYELREGDLLSVDLAVSVDGWVADSARSVVVGTARAEDLAMIEATRVALDAGIAAAHPGNRLGDVSAAMGAELRARGYRINDEFGGHGIGRTMHEAPSIMNDGRPGRGIPLKPGMTLALEPWVLATTDRVVFDDDGWTVRSADGSRGAHSEHTIAITDGDARVLTAQSVSSSAV